MRKVINEARRWDGSKWVCITRFIDTTTGTVYRDVRDFTPGLIANEDLSMDTPIDKFKYLPLMQPQWHEFKGNLDDPDIYIKIPKYFAEEDDAHMERDAWERELKAFHTPGFQHPSIVSFRGCVVENGHVAGIALTRLFKSLHQVGSPFWRQYKHTDDNIPARVTADGITFDHDCVMEGVRPGLEHLASLGLIYLDLKPENIMWGWNEESQDKRKSGRWLLVDFGDVYPAGEYFKHCPGTYGWSSQTGGKAEDLFQISFDILARWLRTGMEQKDEREMSAADVQYAKIVAETREAQKRAASG